MQPVGFIPACQAHEGLVRGWPRRGRLRLDACVDERIDDRRQLLWHAPCAQAPPQRALLAHQLLRTKVLGEGFGFFLAAPTHHVSMTHPNGLLPQSSTLMRKSNYK